MRSPRRGSRPLVAETRIARGDTRSATRASTASTKCDGTATSTVSTASSATSASAVTLTGSGRASPGR